MADNKLFEIQINNYEGPFDLLLELVKERKMDLFDIDLAELATAYVQLINQLKDVNIDLASEYLVMAATLIQLKARMLLEIPSEAKELEKEKQDLLKQLTEYHRYKQVSRELRLREEARQKLFVKSNHDYLEFQPELDETKLDGHSDAVALIIALRKMFERTNALKLRETTLTTFNLSPAQRRAEIIALFKTKKDVAFEDIFAVPTLNHFAITVLTVLDMSKKEELILQQDEQFGEIIIKKGVIND